MKRLLLPILLLLPFLTFSQSYTSYYTGNEENLETSPDGGICLMGGSTEHDEAMKWFLNRANGGDILVLRTSGSDGYNDYMFSDLGVSVNSVETIVCNSADASFDTYLHEKISNAEAIWFAGGDQWKYISFWRNTPVDSLINEGITQRNIVVGGTSAGMAIMGEYYFSAENGTVTSAAALNNPFNIDMTVDSTTFLNNDHLQNVITDTHYDDPDRKGRHVAFMARMITDYGVAPRGIACDEYTAVCIDTAGIARIFGEYPTYDDNIYFLQSNCELDDASPENCTAGNSLNWNLNGEAIKVYKVQGTLSGEKAFNLNDWKTGTGGTWQHWYVDNGNLVETAGTEPNCNVINSLPTTPLAKVEIFPNPSFGEFSIKAQNTAPEELIFTNTNGEILIHIHQEDLLNRSIDVSAFPAGLYVCKIKINEDWLIKKVIIHPNR